MRHQRFDQTIGMKDHSGSGAGQKLSPGSEADTIMDSRQPVADTFFA